MRPEHVERQEDYIYEINRAIKIVNEVTGKSGNSRQFKAVLPRAVWWLSSVYLGRPGGRAKWRNVAVRSSALV